MIWSSIPLLGIYRKVSKSGFWKDTCIPMFIITLFIINDLWKQPKCPSLDEKIKEKWYRHTMAYHSDFKIKETCQLLHHGWTSRHYAKWNHPDSEWQYCIIFSYGITVSKKDTFIEMESRLMITRAGGKEKWGDVDPRVQTFSYTMRKFLGSNVQHGD